MSEYQQSYQPAAWLGGYQQQPPAVQPAAQAADGCLPWDGEIEREDSFLLLEPGFYIFTVGKTARGRYTPKDGSKIPPCNQVTVTFQVGGTEIEENFQLHTKMEWKISSFYSAIGMKQKGERVRMNWPAVLGRSGYLEVNLRTWKRQDGGEGQSNNIKRFLPPWEPDWQKAAQACGPLPQQAAPAAAPAWQPSAQQAAPAAQPAAPTWQPQQQAMYPTAPSPWTPGKF